MKDPLRSQEATILLSAITAYHTLAAEQLYRMFPGREPLTRAILGRLIRQRRLFYDAPSGHVSDRDPPLPADQGLLRCFWVLLDFLPDTEYHAPGEFPAKICFFSGGSMYEVIPVESGREPGILQALASGKRAESRRILLLEDPSQMEAFPASFASAFCLLENTGKAVYYKK